MIVRKVGVNVFTRLNNIKAQQSIILTAIPVKTSNFTTKHVSNRKNRGFQLGVKNQNTTSNGRFQYSHLLLVFSTENVTLNII